MNRADLYRHLFMLIATIAGLVTICFLAAISAISNGATVSALSVVFSVMLGAHAVERPPKE